MKKILFALGLLLLYVHGYSQELNAKVMVMAEQIQGVDQKIFRNLEKSLTDFLNNRKWTNDNFDSKEKIECVFTLILSKPIDGQEASYTGKLNIQASRPVFNTTYSSTMVNYIDNDIAIKFDGFQTLDFNDNRVNGTDPLASNLTAVFAYYAYLVLALDYDSYSLRGGTEFYGKAQNIANNAPEHKAILGWKATENQRNRYWLIDQATNSRFAELRSALYKYHRLGLDLMADDPETARNNMNELFPILERINTDNPSSVLLRFFFYAKADELQNFVARSSMTDKQRIIPVLAAIDVSNAQKYQALLNK